MLAIRGWEEGCRSRRTGKRRKLVRRWWMRIVYSGSLVNARRSVPGPREMLGRGCVCEIPMTGLSFSLATSRQGRALQKGVFWHGVATLIITELCWWLIALCGNRVQTLQAAMKWRGAFRWTPHGGEAMLQEDKYAVLDLQMPPIYFSVCNTCVCFLTWPAVPTLLFSCLHFNSFTIFGEVKNFCLTLEQMT